MKPTYSYSAVVTKVYDGDTITVDLDLGLGVRIMGTKLRLARINTPEVRGPERTEGLKSRDWLRFLLGETITVNTTRKGKYGRYIAEIYHNDVNINDRLVALNLAEYREY